MTEYYERLEAAIRRLRAGFDGVAERYDTARPHYPPATVDDLVALAGLRPGGRVLEIGCGTGQLTVDLAARDLDVTAVELGPAMAEVARRNLAAYPRARVVVGAFEDHPVAEPVDAVVAASAFHWVPPDVRVARTAAALRPGGALAVVDLRHVDGGSSAFFAEMQDCYLRFDPDTPPDFRLPPADEVPDIYRELDEADEYGPVHRRRYTVDTRYTVAGFRALLGTYSTHIALGPERLAGLLDCLGTMIESRYGGAVVKRDLVQLVVAVRR